MDTYNKLPLYKIKFNPDDESIEGIDLISFVKDPAIMRKGIKLNNQFKFAIDEDKMIVVAPALIPDLPIFRRDETGKEYYITFTKDTIEGLVKKFNRNIKTQALNVDHTEEIAPAYILESWIKEDEVYDKSVKYGFNDVPVGSWFISSQITDKEFWNNDVKNGGKYGYSIEGFLDLELSNMKLEILEGDLSSSNVSGYRYNTNNNELIIEFNDGSRYKYSNVDFIRFENIILGDATCISEGENDFGSWFIGKNPSVGAAVYEFLVKDNIPYQKLSTISEECKDCFIEVKPGETEEEYISRCMSKLSDEYPEQDQRLAICYSKWKENMNKLEQFNIYEKNNQIMKKYSFELVGKLLDGTEVYIEPAFEVGADVNVLDENGNKVPVFDAEHVLADGTIVVTINGKITEIKPKVEEPEVEVEQKVEEAQLEENKVEFVSKEEFNALLEAFNNFKSEFSKEIFEAIVDSKINGLVKEEPKETFKSVEPKDYKSFILSRIEALNG